MEPDVKISMTYDPKDGRWRVLVEMHRSGAAWAGEDRDPGRAIDQAKEWLQEPLKAADSPSG